MLRFIQTHKKAIFIGMACLIIPSFIFFGVALDQGSGSAGPVAGRIGSRQVTTGDFVQQYRALRRQLSLMGTADRSGLEGLNLEILTWDRILLLEEARRRRVRVADREIIGWLRTQDLFAPGGAFDPAFYRRFVEERIGLSARKFEEEIRDLLTIQKVLDLAGAEAPEATETQAREFFTRRYAPRAITYVIMPREAATENITVDEDEVKNFYESVRESLFAPETVSVRYVISDGGTDTGAETAFDSPEAEIRQARGLTRQDAVPGVGYSEEVTRALFDLAEIGERTNAVAFEGGVAFFELIEKTPRRPIPYEEAAGDIREQLLNFRRDTRLLEDARAVRDRMDAEGLEAVAAEKGWEIHTAVDYTPGGYLDKAGPVPDFDAAALELAEGGVAVARSEAGAVLARLDGLDREFEEGWEKQKDAIKASLARRAAGEAYEALLGDLRSKLVINTETMSALFPSADDSV